VYPKEVMADLRGWFTDRLAAQLPGCRVLYWT
jgi:spore photoproduct lyase